jgi:hypothetical protein
MSDFNTNTEPNVVTASIEFSPLLSTYKAENENLRASLKRADEDRDKMILNFLSLCDDITALFRMMIEDGIIQDDDHRYLDAFKPLIDQDKIALEFDEERTFRVTCNITKTFDVNVTCDRRISSREIERALEYEFEAQDGDEDMVASELIVSNYDVTIDDVSIYDRDIDVTAQVD